jgi:hypothetical protein
MVKNYIPIHLIFPLDYLARLMVSPLAYILVNATKFMYDVLEPCISRTDQANVQEATSNWDLPQQIVPESPDISQSFQNIHQLCQQPKKSTYDICKNNDPVAQLTLLKTHYKLGETVHALLHIAETALPVHQISAFLETCEHVELPFCVKSKHQTARHTRKVHAQSHKVVLNAKRGCLALTIPFTAAPDYATSVFKQYF